MMTVVKCSVNSKIRKISSEINHNSCSSLVVKAYNLAENMGSIPTLVISCVRNISLHMPKLAYNLTLLLHLVS